MTRPETDRAEPGPGAAAPEGNGAAAGAGNSAPYRDARLDNAKFLLIVLVVVGHAIEPMRDIPAVSALYYWIYFFHMPAFIVISGYLSRSFDGSSNRVEKLVLTVAVPYLIFWTIHQSIYTVERGGLGDSLSLLKPTWTLWFLVALFLWRLSVPVWKRLRAPVLVAFAISLFAATTSLSDTLSLGRVVSFLPFFVLGLSLRREHFRWLDKLWLRLASLVVLGTTAVLAVPISDRLSSDWLFWRDSLTDRDIDPLIPSLGIRLAFMGLALAMTVAFLALTPKRQTWFTALGSYTLYVFLGHSVVFILLKASPWYEVMNNPVGAAITVAIGLAVALLLCTPWVRAGMRWAVEPQMSWFLKREEPGAVPAADRAGQADPGQAGPGQKSDGRDGDGLREKPTAGV